MVSDSICVKLISTATPEISRHQDDLKRGTQSVVYWGNQFLDCCCIWSTIVLIFPSQQSSSGIYDNSLNYSFPHLSFQPPRCCSNLLINGGAKASIFLNSLCSASIFLASVYLVRTLAAHLIFSLLTPCQLSPAQPHLR